MKDKIEDITQHHFKNPKLIETALTHSSAGQATNYERLEFLGDRVLGLAVAEIIYQKFPDESEGDLAKRLSALVQGTTLASVAKEINLGQHIDFSDAERDAGGAQNDHILADVMEALIGALYLDGGLEPCQKFVIRLWGSRLDEMHKPPAHPKTALQEWAQAQALQLPSYKVTGQSGPDHAPVFEVTLKVDGYAPYTAEGRSRQDAEKAAAREFLLKHTDVFS